MTHARIQQQGTTACAGLFVAYDNDRNIELGSVDERDERHACEAPCTILGLV